MLKKQKIMAVAAHADDIEITAGGTLLKYYDQGYEIVYVMSTNNMSGGNSELLPDGTVRSTPEAPPDMMRRRKRECEAAAAMVGAKPIHLDHPQRHYHAGAAGRVELRYGCARPEGVAENIPTILTAHEDKASVARVTELILDHDPACIITQGIASNSIEHVTTGLLVANAFWAAVDKGFRGALIAGREDYTGFGESYVRWDTFVDISDYLDKKIEMIGRHRCQMPTVGRPDHGHRLRPMKWGVVCGCRAAEVFTWVRRYDRPDVDASDTCYSPLIAELNHHSAP